VRTSQLIGFMMFSATFGALAGFAIGYYSRADERGYVSCLGRGRVANITFDGPSGLVSASSQELGNRVLRAVCTDPTI
jgi:hypothetical protein